MPTANNMRRDAAEAREKARRLLAYAETLEAAAEMQEGLQTRHGYGTVRPMNATASVTPPLHPGPKAKAGPMTELAAALGLSSLQAVATALGETYENVRKINGRGTVPPGVQKKADALLKAHADQAPKK